MKKEGLNWEKVGPVFRPEIGLSVYRVKIKSEEFNLRVIFDVNDDCFIVYKVGDRDKFYDNLEGIKSRE